MTILSLSRRHLFAATAGALAAPALLSRASFAQAATETMQKTSPDMSSLKIGKFSATVIRDGKSVVDEPSKTFGTNQKQEDVAALLEANFLPADKFVNSYAPLLVDTGSDVVLFDTGFGEGGREAGNGQLLAGITAAGYSPDQVTLVVLTHMHGDHIGGLMAGGQPAFKNARYAAGQAEFDFWKDAARVGTPAENGHKGVLKNVVPLAEKMTFLKEGSEVAPGITAMEAFGHSPGHLIFNLESEGKRVIVTGDTANHYILSLERPDWEVRFDMDKAKAAATRKRVFDMIASDRVGFVGYHMPFPAVGFVEKIDGGYRYVPKTYQFEL
jgi:glyoxylase-like metal-dependent hydrolase (beta-lactamase superfamily II)